jgi:hypothetical protein
MAKKLTIAATVVVLSSASATSCGPTPPSVFEHPASTQPPADPSNDVLPLDSPPTPKANPTSTAAPQ